MAKIGSCIKCRQAEEINESLRRLTKHHPFPRRNFGHNGENPITLSLCGEHHDEVEALIRKAEQQLNGQYDIQTHDPRFYERIHEKYLGKGVFKIELSRQLGKIKRGKRKQIKSFDQGSLLWQVAKYCAADSEN